MIRTKQGRAYLSRRAAAGLTRTQGPATDASSVHRQGGYALPGAVQRKVPATGDRVKQATAF
ncbi:hypothetical protein DK412_11145 [Methylobacterium sp. 17Sr1-1]|nr:hypothetical protein DK412_11145 [Methylobacterium sp. 17Sr1-1]